MHPTRRATLTGLAGTVLLAGSAWLASPWGLGFSGRDNPMGVRVAHTVPALLGVALLFLGWLQVRGLSQRGAWRTFAMWAAPLLVCPPLLSKDAYAYLEQGWIVLQGLDPYQTGLATIGGPFAERVDTYWQGTTTVYPPLALLVQAAMVQAGGADPLWSLLAMRLPAVVAMITVGCCLPRIARACGQDPDRAAWFALLNPLALVHFVGGMHNDGWAVALGVAGIWLAVRLPRAWLAGCVLVGLGMAVKQPVGLMMVAVSLLGVRAAGTPREAWRSIAGTAAWRLAAGLAATLLGFAIPTVASGWGLGWAAASGAPFTAGSQAVAHTVAAALQVLTGWSMAASVAVVGPVFMAIGAIIIAALGWRFGATRPVTFVALALLAFAFTYPSLQPWYALWGGVLLGAVVLSARARSWAVSITGCLLLTGVLLDHAGLPIPAVQGIAVLVAWPLVRLADSVKMAFPIP